MEVIMTRKVGIKPNKNFIIWESELSLILQLLDDEKHRLKTSEKHKAYAKPNLRIIKGLEPKIKKEFEKCLGIELF